MAETTFKKLRAKRKEATTSLSRNAQKLKDAAADGAQFAKAIDVKSDIEEVRSVLNKEINEQLSKVEKAVSTDKYEIEKSISTVEEEKADVANHAVNNTQELTKAKSATPKESRFGTARNLVQTLTSAGQNLSDLTSEQAKDIAKGSNVKEQAMNQVLSAINATRR